MQGGHGMATIISSRSHSTTALDTIKKMVSMSGAVVLTSDIKDHRNIVAFDDLDEYDKFCYSSYVNKKLAEAEAVANDPTKRISSDEFFRRAEELVAVLRKKAQS
jgi:hypothetical protein